MGFDLHACALIQRKREEGKRVIFIDEIDDRLNIPFTDRACLRYVDRKNVAFVSEEEWANYRRQSTVVV